MPPDAAIDRNLYVEWTIYEFGSEAFFAKNNLICAGNYRQIIDLSSCYGLFGGHVVVCASKTLQGSMTFIGIFDGCLTL